MRNFHHIRMTMLALLGFALCVLLGSCSKKDVVEDEAVMSSTGSEKSIGEGASVSTGESVTSSPGAAGDAGQAATELKTVYFAFDSFALSLEARTILKTSAGWLKSNKTASIQIEGHCDERGTTEYNLALGEKRANAAKNYLVKLRVEKSRVSVISYGEERPVDAGHDESAWAQNRRATFELLSR